VDVIFGAVAAASVLVFALAVLLAPGGTAPGVVGLICGISLAVAGAALVVLVLRMLLTQALARDAEVQHLRSELDEVI
jgi:zinc transporter ZupT